MSPLRPVVGEMELELELETLFGCRVRLLRRMAVGKTEGLIVKNSIVSCADCCFEQPDVG